MINKMGNNQIKYLNNTILLYNRKTNFFIYNFRDKNYWKPHTI